jgi:endonuclease YncB( thermonuclease family)
MQVCRDQAVMQKCVKGLQIRCAVKKVAANAKNNRAMASCQDEAKEAGLGLRADDDPMPPWEWRRR